MEQNDEKFFEELSGVRENADKDFEEENPEVELARASSGVLSSAKPRVKTKRDDSWADGEPEGQLTVDVYQTPTDIIVESAIAGIRPDDLDVTVTTDSISIRGRREHQKTVRDEDYIYQECYWGKFARSSSCRRKLIQKAPM